jgi:modification methylase
VALTSLIDSGQLGANTRLIGRRRQEVYRAQLLPDGRIQVSTGEQFGSLSAAGQFVLGTKSCQGWAFWKVDRNGSEIALAEIRRAALEGGTLEPAAAALQGDV